MEFEWDETKNEANIAKHGIDFNDVGQVFKRAYRYETYSGSDSSRFVVVGETEGRIIAVVFTQRGETIRIISARRARDEEKRAYRQIYQ